MMSGKWFNSKSTAAQHRAVYTKLYYFLKAQRTVLDSILSNLKKLQASSPKTDAKLNEFISLLEKDVLHSDFRTNVFNASKFLIKLKGMNLNQISSFPGYIVKLLNIFSRSCVAFVKIPTMLLSNFKCDKSDNEKNTPIGAIPANNSGDSVICRLCNENIHVDRFEEHIKSCAIAFKSESKVNDINQKLKEEIKLILDKFLKFEWPGEQEFSINVAFPMLHLVILLYQASEIETHADDSLLELDYIESSILMIPIIENIHKKYVTDSIKLLRDKAKLTIALHSATNVLRTTRVSGSAKIITNNSVDINNFDFIKLISSGAYARVFLARNKSTKDIFAIKVTPKSSCTHKNEVVRILTEKDIMLRFNSPYIVNFCMYLFVIMNFSSHFHILLIFFYIHNIFIYLFYVFFRYYCGFDEGEFIVMIFLRK
ncbi:hypothetical protein TRFO_14502 [Tritrichomonas foetus]|uniref:non-specific serine/threonine protein kinase n=1 Tax=Tritrichomonas foetus TaxID=1144522 RepID=A0A1J4KZ94_9EUKA|nr:hypothetical protein TRFO_14502 [Tritrichomonas foetus]|eukprot:OHT15012.1 hypothetical protein TRFO_14502 [Tritrichomonas foetus]